MTQQLSPAHRRRSRGIHTVSLPAAAALLAGLVVVAGLTDGAIPTVSLAAGGREQPARVVVDGAARFEVLTPTLIRLQYAADRRFEDGTTFNVVNRDFPVPGFRTQVEDGWRVIRTADLTLRYREGSGPFNPDNTAVTLAAGGRGVVAHPWSDPAAPPAPSHNLGGWHRSFDPWSYDHHPSCPSNIPGPTCQATLPPLHDGLLSTDGWYLLDDTQTVLWEPGSWPRGRPQHIGAFQDGYFFGYGHDYRRGLRELAQLTGPAPLLPRWMFGISYTRCCTYGQSDYENRVVPEFRAERVPLDALIVDTQWKTSTPASPPSGQESDGWNWNPAFFPRPQGFLDWAHAQGLRTALNVHPTIEGADPRFREADRIAGGLLSAGDGSFGWNWSDPRHAESFSSVHAPFTDQGLDFWWLDWCCDRISGVAMPGLTPDTWVNRLYAEELTRRGQRGFALSRIGASTQRWTGTYPSGAWAEHRYAVHFTGDTWSTWNTLGFESLMTVREGNIGVPYVSHDIGGYLGPPGGRKKDADDLYARWVQFGAFQPVLRLHGTGERLPWEYGPAARAAADRFLRLRAALLPYIYSTAREAYDTGLPMVRGLYLDHPEEPMAYRFDQEYMFGDEVLVAPVTSPGTVAAAQVWFPPGGWTDLFTGLRHQGPGLAIVASPLEHMPVFVRDGGILPMRADVEHLAAGPTTMLLRAFAGTGGSYRIYDDAGQGLGYQHGQYAWTAVTQDEDGRDARITIGAAQGTYPDQPARRTFALEIVGTSQPSGVRVGPSALERIAPGATGPGWWYDPLTRTVHVVLGPTATNQSVRIVVAGTHRIP